ncbi:MAG TPA: nucleotidyltransferase substrate binding protein [Bacteroidales bacterium]|nr:nucleotidyltransferase substrate binding protein [Bacteroidales bacterium]
MESKDIRWTQRFDNYKKAFLQLEKYVRADTLNELEKQGVIKAFEYTFELGWKTLQDLLKEKGYQGIVGPKPVIEQSFQDGYITDGNSWLRMQKSRNLTSHTYDEAMAEQIVNNIRNEYYLQFKMLTEVFDSELRKVQK